ncbi:MAG: glycoside hydrolase family 5 protein, partial [Chloroflexi bacterium]|nr:glycoside hydrolase family 5 protein [Chloroflexota bacterium]
FLEVLNEPVFEGDTSQWAPIQELLVAAIRENAPDHTLIVTNARWSHVTVFVELEPLDDPNLVYNFHFYEPFYFTHQGANWTDPLVRQMRVVPYPSSPDAMETALSFTRNEDVLANLRAYGEERWDIDRLDSLIGQAAAWQAEHGVRVTCNEFGVYKPLAPRADRAQWYTDVRTLLEGYGFGWTMWEYDDSFGIITRQGSTRIIIDEDTVAALGLTLPED